jgi:hypothetical protein
MIAVELLIRRTGSSVYNRRETWPERLAGALETGCRRRTWSMISDETVVRRNPSVESRGLGEEGGAVLLHVGTGAYHGTNDVGALIWEILEEPKSFGTLLARLRDQLEETPPTLAEEIAEFLDELAERELVLLEPQTS